jgi:hypothetical protein
MSNKGINNHTVTALFLMIAAVIITPLFSSCGKESAASATGLNTQLNIINIGPDVYPVDLYINQRIQNAKSYVYAVPSGYIYLSSLATPLQIRATRQTAAGENIIILQKDTALSVNTRYSVFITGLLSDNTRSAIFVADTDAAPTLGRGKVRFINAAARSVNVDVYANGTAAFKNQGFKAITKFLELPAGIYDLKVYAANTTTVLYDLPNTTIQDGRLYTLYTRGVVGRTDSASFAAAMITNR